MNQEFHVIGFGEPFSHGLNCTSEKGEAPDRYKNSQGLRLASEEAPELIQEFPEIANGGSDAPFGDFVSAVDIDEPEVVSAAQMQNASGVSGQRTERGAVRQGDLTGKGDRLVVQAGHAAAAGGVEQLGSTVAATEIAGGDAVPSLDEIQGSNEVGGWSAGQHKAEIRGGKLVLKHEVVGRFQAP